MGTEGGLRWGDPRPGPSRYVSWWECWPLTDEGDTHDDGPVHTPSGANRSQVGATLRDLLRDGPTDVVGQDHVDAVEDAIREVERHDANSGAGKVLDDVVALYDEAYADADPDFFNEDRYRRQLAGHRKAPGWALVTATAGVLAGRPEERATLLVEPENTGARAAYDAWGWCHSGQLRPGWEHAPLYGVLVRPLC